MVEAEQPLAGVDGKIDDDVRCRQEHDRLGRQTTQLPSGRRPFEQRLEQLRLLLDQPQRVVVDMLPARRIERPPATLATPDPTRPALDLDEEEPPWRQDGGIDLVDDMAVAEPRDELEVRPESVRLPIRQTDAQIVKGLLLVNELGVGYRNPSGGRLVHVAPPLPSTMPAGVPNLRRATSHHPAVEHDTSACRGSADQE